MTASVAELARAFCEVPAVFITAKAITVVVLSVFMAVTKLKDENVVQAMQHTQVTAVDSWNEYQA